MKVLINNKEDISIGDYIGLEYERSAKNIVH